MASIKYKGEVIKRISSGQRLILHTEGHKLDGDIEIDGFGDSGSCDMEHVLEVEELPSINVDTTALYKYKGGYYRYDGGAWHEYIVPSGTETFTINGTYDVTNFKKVVVRVPPAIFYDGSVTIE